MSKRVFAINKLEKLKKIIKFKYRKNQLKEFDKMYYSDFTKCVFVAFMVIMHILLINMLIAMMGNTYHQVIKRSTKEYRRQVTFLLYFDSLFWET